MHKTAPPGAPGAAAQNQRELQRQLSDLSQEREKCKRSIERQIRISHSILETYYEEAGAKPARAPGPKSGRKKAKKRKAHANSLKTISESQLAVMKDLIRSNKPREAIIQRMLIEEPAAGSGRGGHQKQHNALAQSVSVRANKFDALRRKARDGDRCHAQQDYDATEPRAVPRSKVLSASNDLDLELLDRQAATGTLGEARTFQEYLQGEAVAASYQTTPAEEGYARAALRLSATAQNQAAATISHQDRGSSHAVGVKAPQHSPRGRRGGPQTSHHQGNRSLGQHASQPADPSMPSHQLHRHKP